MCNCAYLLTIIQAISSSLSFSSQLLMSWFCARCLFCITGLFFGWLVWLLLGVLFVFFVYFCFLFFFVVAILYHFEPCNKQWRKSVYISKVFIIIVHFKTKPTGNSKTPISLTSHLQNLRINCVRCKSLCFSMVLIVCLCRITRNTHTNSGGFTAYFHDC